MRHGTRATRVGIAVLLAFGTLAAVGSAAITTASASAYVTVTPQSNLVLVDQGNGNGPSATVSVSAAASTFDANAPLAILECSGDYDWLGDVWPGRPPSNLCYSRNLMVGVTANATGGLDPTNFTVVGGLSGSDPRSQPDGGLDVNPYDPISNPSAPVPGVSCPPSSWEVSPAMPVPTIHQFTPRDYCVLAVANIAGLANDSNFNLVGFPNEWEPTPITFATASSTTHEQMLDLPVYTATESWAVTNSSHTPPLGTVTVTYRMPVASGLVTGQHVTVTGIHATGPHASLFNKTNAVITVTGSSTTFTVKTLNTPNPGTNKFLYGGQVSPLNTTAAWSSVNGGTITYTVAHTTNVSVAAGGQVTVTGMAPSGYNANGATVATEITSSGGIQFTVTGVSNPGAMTTAGTLRSYQADFSALPDSNTQLAYCAFLDSGAYDSETNTCTAHFTHVEPYGATAQQGLDLTGAIVVPANTPRPYIGGSAIFLPCPSSVTAGHTVPANKLEFRTSDIGHFVSSRYIPPEVDGGFTLYPRVVGIFNNPKGSSIGCEELLVDQPFQNDGSCTNVSAGCPDPNATEDPAWSFNVLAGGFASNDNLDAIMTDTSNTGCVPKSFNKLLGGSGYDDSHFNADVNGGAIQTINIYNVCLAAGDNIGVTVSGQPEVTRENRFLFSFNVPDAFGMNAARTADSADWFSPTVTLPDPGPNASECDRSTLYCS